MRMRDHSTQVDLGYLPGDAVCYEGLLQRQLQGPSTAASKRERHGACSWGHLQDARPAPANGQIPAGPTLRQSSPKSCSHMARFSLPLDAPLQGNKVGNEDACSADSSALQSCMMDTERVHGCIYYFQRLCPHARVCWGGEQLRQ